MSLNRSYFNPFDTRNVGIYRKILLKTGSFFASVSRIIWHKSKVSKSTFGEASILRTIIWNTNRYISLIPRQTSHIVKTSVGWGLLMNLDLSRLTDCFAFVFGAGENEVAYVASQICKIDSIIIDIGANVGTTTIYFSKLANKGTVHSFEPSSEMRKILLDNIKLNNLKNIVVHPYGLFDRMASGKLKMAMAANPGSSYFLEDVNSSEIELKTLDSVLPTEMNIHFIKIDVEGLEYNVIKGGMGLIQRCKPAILFEINSLALSRSNTHLNQIFEILSSIGYYFYMVDRKKFKSYIPDRIAMTHNSIAIHPKGASKHIV